MSEKKELLQPDLRNEVILKALNQARLTAARRAFLAGRKLVAWENDHVVYIDPIEIDPTLKNFNREQSA